jgi:uncharacterized protein (TIGR04255 family)
MSASPPAVSPAREIYSRAPITEAAIDIRCTSSPRFNIADIANLAQSLDTFEITGTTVEITEELSGTGDRRLTEKQLGLVLRDRADARVIWQMRSAGMTLARTEPYERWEPFRDQARHLWEVYAKAAEPLLVNGIAVRYLNRLRIGEVIENLRPFLNLYPTTPWNPKAPPTGFSLQLRVPAHDIVLVVNLATITHVETSDVAILLDLQASIEIDVEPDSERTWSLVERMHVAVEEAFEASITEKMRELIP